MTRSGNASRAVSTSTGTVAPAPPQPFQDVESVEPGQSEIEYHQIVILRGEHVIGLYPVVSAVDRVVGLAQRAREPVGQHRVVFDD